MEFLQEYLEEFLKISEKNVQKSQKSCWKTKILENSFEEFSACILSWNPKRKFPGVPGRNIVIINPEGVLGRFGYLEEF